MSKIGTCLWFNNEAEEAAKFYSQIFKTQVGTVARYNEAAAKASGQKVGSVMTVDMQIENLSVLALNGGPQFKFTPALSFFVTCSSKAEIEEKWKALSSGGKVRMNLDKYPWSEAYGWTSDKFGVEWQLNLALADQKLAPCILFVDELFGKGQSAIDLYTSVFPNSKIDYIARDEKTNTVLHSRISLNGQSVVVTEGGGTHGFKFNESFSIVVHCETQKEIDEYWSKLTSGGGSEGPCGWLKDKFGVSWQIVPSDISTLMKDPVKGAKAMAAVMTMKKLDIAKIQAAADS